MGRSWRGLAAVLLVLLLALVAVVATGAQAAAAVPPEPEPSTGSVAAGPSEPSEPSGLSGLSGLSGPSGPSGPSGLSVLSVLSVLSGPSGPSGPVPASTPAGRWVWPLQPKPQVLAPFDPPAVSWGAGHRGVDLAASVGQPVLAPAAGVVTFSGVVVDRGVVVVQTPAGLHSTFEPVESALPAGTVVTAGERLAQVAATPGHCAPATCLHWGVLRDERYLDPLALVGPIRVVLLPLVPLWPP